MGFRDGDGWVFCTCGNRHWGIHGAAGLLMVRLDLGAEPHVLLQLRAAWTHGGGTWAIPGGALDSHENSVEAAVREAYEEVGIDVRHLDVKDLYSDNHGNWRYDTVIAHVTGEIGAHEANYESDEVRWVALSDIEDYDLHPGLRNSWPHVLPLLTATLP
jgi:8-oxo-dGTP diphosphatase